MWVKVQQASGGICGSSEEASLRCFSPGLENPGVEVFAWIWDWLANCHRQSSTPLHFLFQPIRFSWDPWNCHVSKLCAGQSPAGRPLFHLHTQTGSKPCLHRLPKLLLGARLTTSLPQPNACLKRHASVYKLSLALSSSALSCPCPPASLSFMPLILVSS